MKIVVINFHFPPDPSMGGRRWAGMTKYLARRGWEVEVVTSGPEDSTEILDKNRTVHRLRRRRTLNDVYREFAMRRRRATSSRAISESSETSAESDRSRPSHSAVRAELSSLLAMPDYSQGWISRAFAQVMRSVRDSPDPVIISSGPPHSTHLVGTVAARQIKCPHVIDLRDPWVTRHSDRTQSAGSLPRLVQRLAFPRMERFCFNGAAAIVANTLRLRDRLRSAFSSTRIEWIPNGVDPEELRFEQPIDPFPGLSIAYGGTLYYRRNLDTVMEAFRGFLDRNPDAIEAGSRLRVVGHMDDSHRSRFLSKRAELRLENEVQHLGQVSRDRAMEITSASSLSVVLAQDQDLQVPGKLFELVALGKPLVVIAEPESASVDEAKRLSAPWCVPDDVEGLESMLEDAWRSTGRHEMTYPERLSYESLAEEVAHLLTEVRVRQ